MIKQTKFLLLSVCCTILISSCSKEEESLPAAASPAAKVYSGEIACKWNDLELELIKSTSGFAPPVAARALGYSNLAAYEAVVAGMPDHRSMKQALNLPYTLPYAEVSLRYNWALCSNAAYYQSIKFLFANTNATNKSKIDSLYIVLKNNLGNGETAEVIARSEGYGAEVANQILDFSKTDNGHEAYTNLFPASYTVPAGPGYWEPTPPLYQSIPLLPYWGSNRTFISLSQLNNCMPPAPLTFSTDPGSDFYKEAMEVYTTVNHLTNDQKAIASFWADGANTYTPPGHLMNISTQLLKEDHADLAFAAEVYVRMGIACSDAFIACWKAKYTHNLLRPVTYIQKYVDASWSPFISTPPFPEYTSGHSSVSGAASVILTSMFGSDRSFTDRTNEWLGFPARSFSNFYEAAEEAASSRLYGGIHYSSGNKRGIQCGKQLGTYVAAIPLKK